MALARILANLDGLSEDIKKEYKKVGDEFVLDVSGDDNTALLNAKNHEKQARQAAEQRARDIQGQLDTVNEQMDEMRRGNIPKGDVAALEESWKTKLSAAEAAAKAKETHLNSHLDAILCDNVAFQVASRVSTAPDLLLPHIRSRLQSAEVDGKMTTRVKDSNGQLSALTVEELEAEIKADKRYASIIIGNNASGAGGDGGGKGQGGGGNGDKKFSELNDADRIAWFKRDPEGFKKAAAAARSQ